MKSCIEEEEEEKKKKKQWLLRAQTCKLYINAWHEIV